MTIAIETPISSNKIPSTPIKTNSDPILTIAEYPTLVDSIACIFALSIKEIDVGIIETTII